MGRRVCEFPEQCDHAGDRCQIRPATGQQRTGQGDWSAHEPLRRVLLGSCGKMEEESWYQGPNVVRATFKYTPGAFCGASRVARAVWPFLRNLNIQEIFTSASIRSRSLLRRHEFPKAAATILPMTTVFLARETPRHRGNGHPHLEDLSGVSGADGGSFVDSSPCMD